MDEQRSATIIPFPVRRTDDAPPAIVRLSDSLKTLSAALAQQRDALERWRDALAALSQTTKAMGAKAIVNR